tara:strand:- start:4505 stop:4654 length:150 start_codon:yes stop_codon:yes gene_type:complete
MDKLSKKLEELKMQKTEIEFTYHQVIGAIKAIESLKEEEVKEDSKKTSK